MTTATPSVLVFALSVNMIVGCVTSAEELVEQSPDLELSSKRVYAPGTHNSTLAPDEYWETATGRIHPSCVYELADDERLLPDGSIQGVDGTVYDVPPCPYPYYDKDGNEMPPASTPQALPAETPQPVLYAPAGTTQAPTSISGYLALAIDDSPVPFQFLRASWVVPEAPSTQGIQRLAYFPGLQRRGPTTILQPVLRWFARQGGWSLLTEHCCFNGNGYTGQHFTVPVGAQIYGDITGTECDANGVCANWIVQATASKGGVQMGSRLFTQSGQRFDVALVALEAFDIDHCRHLSASGSVTYSDLLAVTVDGRIRTFNWTAGAPSVSSPCRERTIRHSDAIIQIVHDAF